MTDPPSDLEAQRLQKEEMETLQAFDEADAEMESGDLRRKRFFEVFNRQYGAIRTDEEAWREEQDERRLWGHA